jgi:hypothetical protein
VARPSRIGVTVGSACSIQAEPSPLRDGTCHFFNVRLETSDRRRFVGSSQAEHPSAPEAIEDQQKSGGSL